MRGHSEDYCGNELGGQGALAARRQDTDHCAAVALTTGISLDGARYKVIMNGKACRVDSLEAVAVRGITLPPLPAVVDARDTSGAARGRWAEQAARAW